MAKINEYMSHQVHTTSPDTFAHEAIDTMCDRHISSLLVKDGENFVGIVTKSDWMLLVLRGECDPKAVKVSSVMTAIKNTVDQNDTIAKACALMEENKIRHLPVTDDGKIVGMLSVKDLEKYYLSLHKQTDY